MALDVSVHCMRLLSAFSYSLEKLRLNTNVSETSEVHSANEQEVG